jgi:hypothetical protein
LSYIGNELLDVAAETGLYYVLVGAGDSFSVGTTGALNILSLLSLRIDVELPGDGVIVSMYVR